MKPSRWLAALWGAIALSVALCSTAADTLELERYRGKVVVLDFWASWCAPCRESFPWLNEMQTKYAAQGLVVIGVNVDRERTDAEKFLRSVPASFQLAFDPTGDVAARYRVPGMPTSIVVDRSGRVVATHIGFRRTERDAREAEIARLLSVRPPDAGE